MSRAKPNPPLALVTGFPTLIAKRVALALLAESRDHRVCLLTLEKYAAEAQAFCQDLPARQRQRVEVRLGDVAAIDLGLAGAEVKRLVAETTHLFHLAEINYPGVERPEVRRVNVEGAANALAFAEECTQLRRLLHYSTAFVSGDREGVIMEDELDEGQSFHDAVEETKFEAEVLVRRAMSRLPITVARPAIVVGDSETGEIDRLFGPYYAVVLHLLSPRELRLPLPGSGVAPLNMVPIDYVAKAAVALALDESARGQTFHLTDPNPLSTRRVIELVAQKTGKKPPLGRIPARLTHLLMRAPVLERFLRAPRQALERFNRLALYNCRNAMAALAPRGIACPPLEAYITPLIAYAERQLEARKKRPSEEEDAAQNGPATPHPQSDTRPRGAE